MDPGPGARIGFLRIDARPDRSCAGGGPNRLPTSIIVSTKKPMKFSKPLSTRLRAAATFAFLAAVAVAQPCPPTTIAQLGSSCGDPTPHVAVTGIGIGETAYICIDSEFPGIPGTMEGHVIVFASAPPASYSVFPPTYAGPWGPCVVYVDLENLRLVQHGQLDAQGDWCLPFPILNDPALLGTSINIQARVWATGGPFEGGDHLSNGLQVTFGCTGIHGEGRTPGFWKQPHHFQHWTAPFTPTTLFSDVFDDAFPGKTLLQVLAQGGGGLNALGRHAVAALLNSASGQVDYALSTFDVITLFNGAVPGSTNGISALKDYFEDLNELEGGFGE